MATLVRDGGSFDPKNASIAVDGAIVTTAIFFLWRANSFHGMPPIGWTTIYIFSFYYFFLLGEYGKSVGNAATGTLVVGYDGSRLGYRGSSLRLAGFMGPLFVIMSILHFFGPDINIYVLSILALFATYAIANIICAALPTHRTLYDTVTGTRVIYSPGIDGESLRKAPWYNAVMFISASAYVGIILLVLICSLTYTGW